MEVFFSLIKKFRISLIAASFVCKTWYNVSKNDYIWYQVAKQEKLKGSLDVNESNNKIQNGKQLRLSFFLFYFSLAHKQGQNNSKIENLSANREEKFYCPKPFDASTKSWRELVYRNCCIHLSQEDLQYHLRNWNSAWKQKVANMHCNMCNSLAIWICLKANCNFVGCGRDIQSHMLHHYKETKHSVVMQLRRLEIWCYLCDKYLRESPSKTEKLICKQIISMIRMPHLLHSHTEGWIDAFLRE